MPGKDTPPPLLQVRIQTPERVIYEGSAKSVSSQNRKGPFDILPFHSLFISIIEKQVDIVEHNGHQQRFPIEIGIMHVTESKVEIFLEKSQRSSSRGS